MKTKNLRLKPKVKGELLGYGELVIQELTAEQEEFMIESQLELIRLERGLK